MFRDAREWISSFLPALAVLTGIGGSACACAAEASAGPALATRLRRPVALLTFDEHLLVGNRRSGTITIFETRSRRIIAEHVVAKRIADMAILDRDTRVLVLDDAEGELRGVSLDGRSASVRAIADLPSTASRLTVAGDRRRVFVTAKWSRRVLSLTLDSDLETITRRESLDLPFAPGELLLVNGDRTLLVADAFGGKIAVVDAIRFRTLAVHSLHGHNIRGLASSPDGRRLLVAHQQMPERARADYEELHWGRMVSNAVQVFDLDEVLSPEAGPLRDGWLDRHGGIGGALGDPAGVVTGPLGVLAIAFSGVGEIVVRTDDHVRRIAVGSGPGAMAIRGDRLYVANRFDDSVSIVDLDRAALVETISLGPAPELTAVERGEKLFFDARISHDGWMSCHSCHTDGHSSGRLVDTLGDGDYGAPKRVPSLLGARGTEPFGWTASSASLGEQVRKSVATTMHGDSLGAGQASDLVAYLESLEAPPPVHTARRELLDRGRELFESLGCVDCHTPPSFTSGRNFDVGLADERDRRAFNPPSLRGVGQREPLFHDGRARGLEDVLQRFRHQLDAPLARGELEALLAFLREL